MAASSFGTAGRSAAVGFIAGAVSVLTFHALAWWVFYLLGMVRIPPYPMAGNMIGVPIIISLAFWAGLWGIVVTLVAAPRIAQPFWIACLVVSAAATLVEIFVIPPLRGNAINLNVIGWVRQFVVNGVWGIGVAIIAPFAASLMQQRSTV